MKFNIVSDDGEASSATVFASDGQMLVATREHPQFADIVAGLSDTTMPEEDVIALFDIGATINRKFLRISDRITLLGTTIYMDSVPVDNALTQAIVKFHSQRHPSFEPLVNFMEKLETNPNQHSREQLFRWMSRNGFSIHPDGDLIAYKGVNRSGRGDDDMDFLSSHAGEAIVNGVWVKGRIPTSPGTIVEMPRDKVQHDPRVGCHTGLHAGNYSYANSFAQVTLQVKINPRDVVSVPTDSGEAKMRVCRYWVLDVVTKEDTSMLFVERELKTLFTGLAERKPAVKVKKLPAPKPTDKPTKKKAPAKATTIKGVAKKAKKSVAAKKAAAPKKPKYYEDFVKADFVTRPYRELRWLAKQWEVKVGSSPKAEELAGALARTASARRRKSLKPSDKVKITS